MTHDERDSERPSPPEGSAPADGTSLSAGPVSEPPPGSAESAPREQGGDGPKWSAPPPSRRSGEPTRPAASLRETLGEACGVGLACGLFGSIPAALRTSQAGGSLLGGWITTAAVVLPLLALTIGVSHTAGRGFRMVTGLRAGRSTAASIALWIGLLAPILLLLGSVLFEHTHHRGLGGATFGVVALLAAIGTALVANRLVSTGRWLVARGLGERTVAIALALLAIGPLFLLALPLLRGHDQDHASRLVGAALIDGLIFSVTSAVAVSFDLGTRAQALAQRVGLYAGAATLAVGFFWLSLSPGLGVSIRAGGGLAAALIGGLERWTDRDGDGYGAHFGGRDCDEGDPARHPGATDARGDGVDQDCDGVDGSRSDPQPSDDVAPAAPAAPPPPAPAAAPPARAAKPSVVLMLLDSVRFDHTSLGDPDKKTTPALAALAAKGTSFGAAFASASDPQRATMPIFAAAPWAAIPKDRREWPTLKAEADTLAERMKAAGYRTVLVSSFQWLSRERGFDQGFDQVEQVFEVEHPEKSVTGPLAVRAARAAIEAQKSDPRPLFLVVQLFDAHEQYKHHEGLDFGKGKTGAYDSEVAFVDRQIGDIVSAVSASPSPSDTALIVSGLYGEAFDEHDVTGHGKELYQEQLHVPLVVVAPGRTPARVDGLAVSTAALPATVLDLAGLAAPEKLPPALPASAVPGGEPKAVIVETSKRAAAVLWPFKIVRQDRKGKERWLLFDLAADPKETKDRSGEQRDDFLRMKALLDQAVPPPKRSRDDG